LYSEKKDKEINRLQLKQKQVENEELAHLVQIKQQRNRLNQLIIIIIGSLIVFLIVILLVIRRKGIQVKKLNRELLKRNSDIAAQKDEIVLKNQELSNLNHSKDQLFSVVGHDLRSPIVSIIQTVDLLRSNNLSAEETTQVLDHFFEKLTATATMLDNLLLWANNQKNAVQVDRTHFSLPQLVKQLLMVLNFQAKEKNIQIHHHLLNEALIAADLNHARIIMHNLISNAIKFTPSGGDIYIHYFIKPDKVGVVVRDTGVGMSKEKLERLFKWVGKEISTYGTANEKGIGIGLMLVKKYAAENHADVVVNSGTKGTEFVICFDPGQVS
jgi:signal transduction histidine kinase